MSTPLRTVLTTVQSGANTRAQITARTGLDAGVVDAAVDHLLRLGAISMPSLRTACPSDGCAGCGSVVGPGCTPVTIAPRPAG